MAARNFGLRLYNRCYTTKASTDATATIAKKFENNVVPSYGRYNIALTHGKGPYIWDASGKKYLDAAGGIAVNCLGHAHPEIVETVSKQAAKIMHCSNLYYTEQQGSLATELAPHFGVPGKIFFSNSGGEANEGMFKLARRFGQDPNGDHSKDRYEIITTINSFHGRTLAGIAATGQDKIKKGFYPMVDGFKHVAYNDVAAAEKAIGPKTIAIMLEGIQGEGGILPATADYLLGLRKLCDKHNLLLLMDGVQCGHFRSGRFQSYQRILERSNEPAAATFSPDAVSMAKALGGGFPIGGFWAKTKYADLLQPGYHGTTYGGNPLGCAVALKVLEIIKRDKLEQNVRELGDYFKAQLKRMHDEHPDVVSTVRGEGFMLGLELSKNIPAFAAHKDKPQSSQFVDLAHHEGLLLVTSGSDVLRILPPFNWSKHEVDECLGIINRIVTKLSAHAK
eukprot:Colp12_sorted_trinity150504_noHs@32527